MTRPGKSRPPGPSLFVDRVCVIYGSYSVFSTYNNGGIVVFNRWNEMPLAAPTPVLAEVSFSNKISSSEKIGDVKTLPA